MGNEESPVRASPEERDAAEQTLRTAVVDGRITLDEFGDRIAGALTATYRQELVALTADVPAVVQPSVPAKAREWVFGVLGGDDRSGRWKVAKKTRVVNFMGGADLDLRSATISGPVTEITVVSVMGGSAIVVPDSVEVEPSGFALLGGNDVQLTDAPAPPNAPLIRIKTISIMGGTDIKRA
ncbi:DUF1707 SHOCT-like domain-containing protein [Ilumatobacter nonamiensis]|uniref:DUF1707 SHOCT-like domain-containing protein n=1 Tax=Ilumatobacter nonamiensis TaxID=467093 RepID=UPI00058C7B65|nr:DUF1707 domain-containing protein [Ilumatobacter nonamiensis]